MSNGQAAEQMQAELKAERGAGYDVALSEYEGYLKMTNGKGQSTDTAAKDELHTGKLDAISAKNEAREKMEVLERFNAELESMADELRKMFPDGEARDQVIMLENMVSPASRYENYGLTDLMTNIADGHDGLAEEFDLEEWG